jgi:hypothetical protein
MIWLGHMAHMAEMRNAYKHLVGRPGGKRPLGRSRCRWEDNTGMCLKEIGWEVADWINLAEDRDQWQAIVNTVMSILFGEDQLESLDVNETIILKRMLRKCCEGVQSVPQLVQNSRCYKHGK